MRFWGWFTQYPFKSSVVENKWNLFYQSGNAVCNADETGYTFGTSSYNHDGCFCILSCKEN